MSAVELPNRRSVEGVDIASPYEAHSLPPCGVDVLIHNRRLGPRSDTAVIQPVSHAQDRVMGELTGHAGAARFYALKCAVER